MVRPHAVSLANAELVDGLHGGSLGTGDTVDLISLDLALATRQPTLFLVTCP